MMHGAITKNGKPLERREIPDLPPAEFERQAAENCRRGRRPIAFFGAPEPGPSVRLYCVTGNDENSRLAVLATRFAGADKSYRSFTPEFPAFHLFEREALEEFGITPVGHPSPKPVRAVRKPGEDAESYPFDRLEGEELHEVGVGPIHAGVIEPGHFRFTCQGETVHRLEIHLGYQRRGVERLFLRPGAAPETLLRLAESIAGDSTLAHGTAFAAAYEGLSGTVPSPRALSLRALALELERAAMHTGDLAALSGDVAYLPAHATLGATRTVIINTLLEICGSRFGRGLLAVGGVHGGMDDGLKAKVLDNCDRARDAVERVCDLLFSDPSVLARFEGTGAVTEAAARSLGLVGPAARASGAALDVRADYPAGAYAFFPAHRFTLSTGDVFARAYIRFMEIKQSFALIREIIANLPAGGELITPPKPLRPSSFVASLVEGWRGETVHIALTDNKGGLERYKIVDPSFHNWSGLEEAVQGEGISDFPLCNKSFNLSYCGFDL